MNFKEQKECNSFPSAYSFKFFDKRIPEEDVPVKNITDEQQLKFEDLDLIFEDFFDENSLQLAKVI